MQQNFGRAAELAARERVLADPISLPLIAVIIATLRRCPSYDGQHQSPRDDRIQEVWRPILAL
jgi:hypothetical protein